MVKGCCWFNKANGNRGTGCTDSTSNRGRCEEPQHALHIFQLKSPPEPVLKQANREESLTRVKEGEDYREPYVPPNRETARGGRDEDGSGQ